jgi:hypothetical protein
MPPQRITGCKGVSGIVCPIPGFDPSLFQQQREQVAEEKLARHGQRIHKRVLMQIARGSPAWQRF